LSIANERIRADVGVAVSFTTQALETPPSTLEYIGIIATNDFFVQVKGTNNNILKGCSGKVYGYRARADASIYSALVQSEVLSA
jgi:AMMECR1 domain-containing protein